MALSCRPDGHDLPSTGWRNLTGPTEPIGWHANTTAGHFNTTEGHFNTTTGHLNSTVTGIVVETGTSVYVGQTGWVGTGTGFAMGTGTFGERPDKGGPTSTCSGCIWTGLPDSSEISSNSSGSHTGNSTTPPPPNGAGLNGPSFGLILFAMVLAGCF